jgi:peroxiredoxin
VTLSVGDEAPDFELPNDENQPVKLSDFRGEKAVALVFIPFAWSGICQNEFCELRDNISDFEAKGVQVIGISCDRPFSLGAWKKDQGFGFPLVSDGWPHGATAQAYGCFNADLGVAMRQTVVIDKAGKVAGIFQSADLRTPRDKAAYDEILASL